jgi:hypothetical protein
MISVTKQQIFNKQEYTATAREQLSKHIPVGMVSIHVCAGHIEELYEDNWGNLVSSVLEAVKKGDSCKSWKGTTIQ